VSGPLVPTAQPSFAAENPRPPTALGDPGLGLAMRAQAEPVHLTISVREPAAPAAQPAPPGANVTAFSWAFDGALTATFLQVVPVSRALNGPGLEPAHSKPTTNAVPPGPAASASKL
jgi:hypothetical protein